MALTSPLYLKSVPIFYGTLMFKIMNIIKKVCDFIALKIDYLIVRARMRNINKKLGGGERIINYPYVVAGYKNILMQEPSSIGPGATIYTTKAKLIIKNTSLPGPT